MFYGIAQFIDLLVYHKLHLFFIFSCYVWGVFLIKYYNAKKYTPTNENGYSPTLTVIVPTFNEHPHLFENCIKSIYENKPTEIIVMFDEHGVNNHAKLKKIASRYNAKICYSLNGKRKGVAETIKKAKGEIIILIDSDTILKDNKTLHNLVLPLKNKKVGGVTTEQRIFSPNSFLERVSDWMEDLRWKISNRAMSVHGVVGCLPGRAIAIRKEYILPVLDEFTNDLIFRFIKRKAISGDDRCLTNLLLKQGYDTVFQSTARCYTQTPNKLIKFIKMHIRWARTSQRYTIKSLGWMIHRHPILLFSFITDIITPFFFLIVVLGATLNILFQYDPTLILRNTFYDSLFMGLVIGLFGMNLSLGLRYIPHLKDKPKDILYLPLFTLFMTCIMIPVRIYGFLTMYKDEWLTRE